MTSFMIGIITIVAIYCILTLGLNLRWGYCGLLDFGIAGFFLIGSYTAAILISAPSESFLFGVKHTVGFINDHDLHLTQIDVFAPLEIQ